MKRGISYACALALLCLAPLPLGAQEGLEQPLTLERAVALAISRNERALAAEARLEAADARVSRAKAFFFPDVIVTGNYTRRAYETVREIGGETVTIQSLNAYSGTTFLNATLFNARAFPLYRQARHEREGTRYDALYEKRLVGFEAADAFLVTLSFEAVQAAAVRRRDFAKTSLNDARARFEVELVSSNDVTKAELELASAELEVSRARATVDTAYLQLGNLLAAEVAGPLVSPDPLLLKASSSLATSDQVILEAQQNRLDLTGDRERVEALREFSREPAMRLIPSLMLNGQFRSTNEGGIGGRPNDGSVALNLTWNAFDGGEARAERRERKALVRAAELDLQRATRDVSVDVRSAIAQLTSDQASILQAEAAVEAARKNSAETILLYREGLVSALDVADAAVRLFEAEVNEARARYQLGISYLDLRAATGSDPL